ncbi:hypothetical protein CYMTET_16365, partial [Cymbomonas tetramitiformis]
MSTIRVENDEEYILAYKLKKYSQCKYLYRFPQLYFIFFLFTMSQSFVACYYPFSTDLCVVSRGFGVMQGIHIGFLFWTHNSIPLRVLVGEWIILSAEAWSIGVSPLLSVCSLETNLEALFVLNLFCICSLLSCMPFAITPAPYGSRNALMYMRIAVYLQPVVNFTMNPI